VSNQPTGAADRPGGDEAAVLGRHVFARGSDLPVAVRAEGSVIWDAQGRRYLDAAGGAIAVGIGHGDASVARAMAEQTSRIAFAHATKFTSEPVERYASEVAALLPMTDALIYPVSGGSEAVETALKMARSYHLARGNGGRDVIIAREGSYHGNTLGALDASGRRSLRAPYTPWLGRAEHVPAPYEYRCPAPSHPVGCGAWHAEMLDRRIREIGTARVACFIAEPVAGATLAAAVPPDDYWPAVAEVCRSNGVLLIADEVMTGFGRTGTWFASEHWGLRPDIVTAAKGASSGYWPLGFAACTDEVFDTIAAAGGFVHGFTYSHSVVGATVGLAVLERLRDGELVAAAREKGERLRSMLAVAFDADPHVGDIRGLGLMIGVELVRDRDTREPFARSDRITERVLAAAKEDGLLLYPSAGCANGADGDAVMLGPPFVITGAEMDEAASKTAAAVERVLGR
jgi:adenosylmethionine-8-amino-7-oxononanoate aminotransferase